MIAFGSGNNGLILLYNFMVFLYRGGEGGGCSCMMVYGMLFEGFYPEIVFAV